MSKSKPRYLAVIILTLIGVASQHLSTVAQETDRGERGGRSVRSMGRSNAAAPQASFAQFGGGRGAQPNPDESSTDEPRDAIALTVWALTMSNSSSPESDALVGNLVDKANKLPTIVGTAEDVRELVGRLKAAGLL